MAREWPPSERQRAVWLAIVAVNEQPWEPLRGMVKRRCDACGLWYAKPRRRRGVRCPDCELSRAH
jgi:hypothetical protein